MGEGVGEREGKRFVFDSNFFNAFQRLNRI